MDIRRAAIEWAKAETFSSMFFVVFGIAFVLGSVGFWHLGRTETARAFIVPLAVAGVLLVTIGAGLLYTNKARASSFANTRASDIPALASAELERAERTITEYKTVVFTVIPLIAGLAALTIVFVDTPLWRAISITTIAMMAIILLIDSNASARLSAYGDALTDLDGNPEQGP